MKTHTERLQERLKDRCDYQWTLLEKKAAIENKIAVVADEVEGLKEQIAALGE